MPRGVPPAQRSCPSCGKAQSPDARFCQACNASLGDAVAKHDGAAITSPSFTIAPVELPTDLPESAREIEASHFADVLAPHEEAQKRHRPRRGEEQDAMPMLPAAPKVVATSFASMASLDRGLRPDPGIQAEPFHWRDLPDGEPPVRRRAGEGRYAVYHAIEVDADVRITYQTVVGAKKNDDGTLRLLLDARTSVQKRTLLEVMDKVRNAADQHARRSREAAGRKLSRRRANVLRWPRGSRRVGFGLVKAEAKVRMGIINLRRQSLRGAVEVPDAIFSSLLRMESHLSTRIGRRSLWDGIKRPDELTAEQRSVVLFMTVVLLGVSVLILNSIIALLLPSVSAEYRNVLINVGWQLVALNPVFSPPIEIIVIDSAIRDGPVLSFASLFFGKILAAWLLFLLGDTLRGIVERHLGKTEKGKRRIAWLKANTAKYGFIILFVDTLVPGMPDQILFVLAFTGVRFRSWMGGIALGTAVKYLGIIAAVYLIGPETVRHLLP